DLVIDAAYGTGFRGTYDPPDPGDAPVLAVDVPSGPSARADATVTFAALKPALLFGDGPDRAGAVEVADIGLDVSGAGVPAVVDADGLNALGGPDSLTAVVRGRTAATILTPHEGEFARLAGHPPATEGTERVDDVRRLAARSGAIVLLKGPTTVVAAP